MTIKNEFKLGQKVYLHTDPEQYPRLVTAITVNVGGVITYSLACGSEEPKEYYECEISENKNVIGDYS
jgi:hypothetical protein